MSKKYNQLSDAPRDPGPGFERALDAAIQSEDYARVLDLLESAPRWIKNAPEFLVMRATALISLGEEAEALRVLRELERKNPRFTPLYFPLAMMYMDRDWAAHALQAAQRIRKTADELEGRKEIELLIQEATHSIQENADQLGLSFETMQRACFLNEQAQIAMDEDRLPEADHFCREAIKVAPDWTPPYNNRAQILYFSGRVAEAIAVTETVLAREDKNIFALSSMVTFLVGMDQPDRAQEYARTLEKLSTQIPADDPGIDQIISALAMTEDTPALWKLARRFLKEPAEALLGRTWLCLAVAAIRSGKWKEALKLLEKGQEEGIPPAAEKLLEKVRLTQVQRHPHLEWMPTAYPGIDLLMRAQIAAELEALVQNFTFPLSPAHQRRFTQFFEKYPFMKVAFKRMLWDEDSNPIALEILGQVGLPEADAEIVRFAQSQVGTRDARLHALMALINAGRYSGPKIITAWDEKNEQWQPLELNLQRIGDIEVKASPQTLKMIQKAMSSPDIAETIALLRKAVEMEPTSAIAVFNLGVKLAQNGQVEEGEALIYRSVEIDPDYTYGHASIALSEAQAGHEKEALDHLEIVGHTELIAPETAVIANLARMVLALDKQDVDLARRAFDSASAIDPEHDLLKYYEELLKEAEVFKESFGFLAEYQRESAERAHRKLMKSPLTVDTGLQACLETHTVDMLASTARLLDVDSNGRKSERVSRLVNAILDPDVLKTTLDELLTPTEREALKWVLDGDGVQPWEEFARKYGDDSQESTFWQYHEPESTAGHLRRAGLLYTGTLEGQGVVFIPADLRPLLRKTMA